MTGRHAPTDDGFGLQFMATYATLLGAWTVVWAAEQALEGRFPDLADEGPRFAWWTAMKLVVWVVPSVLALRRAGETPRDVLGPRGLAWGIAAGVVVGGIALAARVSPVDLTPRWALVNAVLVSPIVEELAFRGAILGALSRRLPFTLANTITALLFVGAHLPGWSFQGRLGAALTYDAPSVFLLGLLFGYVAHYSRSVGASVLAHALNNLCNA